MKSIEEIANRAAAKRYAELLAVAAGAEERIRALTDALEQSEFLRMTAEAQLSGITYPDGFQLVWHMGTDEPPADVLGLIDITNGTAYRRERDPRLWRIIGRGTASTRYEWPIEDAGPFIALPDDFGLSQLGLRLDEFHHERDEINRCLWANDVAVRSEGWDRPELHVRVDRAFNAKNTEIAQLKAEVRKLTEALDKATRSDSEEQV